MNKQRRAQIRLCTDDIEEIMSSLGRIQQDELEEEDNDAYLNLIGTAYRSLQNAVDTLTYVIIDDVIKTRKEREER